jgi:hypothetical protein
MTRTQDPTTERGWRSRVVALVVGAGIGVALAWVAWPSRDHVVAREPSNREQTRELLAAVRAAQRASFTEEGTFRRTTEGRTSIDDPEVVVQRPPDRMAFGFGGWSGTVGGRAVQCSRDGRHGPYLACSTPPRPAPVADEVARLRQLLGGAHPLYRASALGGGCYQLRLVADVEVEPEYGQRAELCFDPATNAPTRRRIEHANATDDIRYTVVSSEVDPADLAIR